MKPPVKATYYFDSFGDSSLSEFLASGTVGTTGRVEGDYSELKVLSNSSQDPSFTGALFWVISDVKTDGSAPAQLYTDPGHTGTGMYVNVYAEAPKRSVSITVTDGTDPIQGATVVIDDDEAHAKTTGSAGGCSCSLVDGEHSISVSKEDYTTYEDDITVAYDETSFTVTLTLAQDGMKSLIL